MPHTDNVLNILLGNTLSKLLHPKKGFLLLVVDLDDGDLSLVSDAPSIEAVKATLEAALNVQQADSYFLDPNPEHLN